jgi:hypothetical protein
MNFATTHCKNISLLGSKQTQKLKSADNTHTVQINILKLQLHIQQQGEIKELRFPRKTEGWFDTVVEYVWSMNVI